MENTSIFRERYQKYYRVGLEAAREQAKNYSKFRFGNGAIVVGFVPLCPEVDKWLGGLSAFDKTGKIVDCHEYYHVATIKPGGSHTIEWEDPEDGHVEPVNCMAFAHMKLAYASNLLKKGLRKGSEEYVRGPFMVNENGYADNDGPVVATLYKHTYNEEDAILRIWFVTSGADSEDDLECSTQGVYSMVESMLKDTTDKMVWTLFNGYGYFPYS